MTVSPPPRTTPAGAPMLLGHAHRAHLAAFLERDVLTNLFALSWLENHGIISAQPNIFHFRALLSPNRTIRATSLVITDRLVLLDALDDDAADTLGRWYRDIGIRFQHVLSAAPLVRAFWQGYTYQDPATPTPTARLISPQKLLVLPRTEPLPAPTKPITGLRCARPDELDPLFIASAQMHREETGEDPLADRPDIFRSYVLRRIQEQRAWVWFDDRRRLLFKVDISAQSRYGVQLSGVWTAPFARNQGIAQMALRDLCAELFRRGWTRITLYVNDDNMTARRLYDRLGFVHHADYQTIFVAP